MQNLKYYVVFSMFGKDSDIVWLKNILILLKGEFYIIFIKQGLLQSLRIISELDETEYKLYKGN